MGFVVMSKKGTLVRKGAVGDKAIKGVADALGITKKDLVSATTSVYIFRGNKGSAKRRTRKR